MITFVFLLNLLSGSGVQAPEEVPDAVRFYERGDFQPAAEILSQKILTSGNSGWLHLWLGKSYIKLRKWKQAVEELEKAVEIEPANSLYRLWLGRAYGKKAEHSSFFTALGPARRVAKEFEKSVELSPGNLDARFDLLEFYLEAPGLVGGGKDKALAQVAEIARHSPRLGYTARARVFEKEKEWDKARDELLEAVLAFPSEPSVYLDLAGFFLHRSQFADAAANAQKALQLATDRNAALILWASRIELGLSLAEAERALQEMAAGPLRDEDPSFEDVYFWLGRARLAQGRKAEAAQAFQTALRFNPDHSRAKAARDRIR